MKTKRQWLESLPSPYKEEAIENMEKYGMSGTFDRVAPTASEAIDRAFVWADTPQGHSYWNKVYMKFTDEQFSHNNTQI